MSTDYSETATKDAMLIPGIFSVSPKYTGNRLPLLQREETRQKREEVNKNKKNVCYLRYLLTVCVSCHVIVCVQKGKYPLPTCIKIYS